MSLEPVELCDLTQEGAIFNPILDAAISDEDILVDERRLEEIDLQPIGDKLMDMMRRGVPLKRYRNPMEIYQMLLYGLKRLANKKREVLAKKAEKALEEARATLLQDVDMNTVKELVDSNKPPKKPKKHTGTKKKTPAGPEKGDDTLFAEFMAEKTADDLNLMVEDFPIVNRDESFGFENPPGLYEEPDICSSIKELNITPCELLDGPASVSVNNHPVESRHSTPERSSNLENVYDLMNEVFGGTPIEAPRKPGVKKPKRIVPEKTVVPVDPPIVDGAVQVTNVDESGLLDEAAGGNMAEEVLPEVNNEKLNSSRDVFDLLLPKWQAGDFPLRLNDILPKENSSLLRRTTGIESLMRLYEKDIVSIKFDEDRAITNILPGPLLLNVGNVRPEMLELYSSDSN